MTAAVLQGVRLRGVATCTPSKVFDTERDSQDFDPKELKKIVSMVGIKERRIVDDNTCSSDLCLKPAKELLSKLKWEPETVDALIMVTQTPDYFLPSTSCLIHRDLKLSEACATFDVGLGCSGYPYGLWLASMMISSGSVKRALVLHGETPSLITYPQDRATSLLFGDAGSATALEKGGEDKWGFCLHTDGQGYQDLIIPGRAFRTPEPDDDRDKYLHMNGTNLFNFTIKKVPALIEDTLNLMGLEAGDINSFIFHQSNKFMMRHIANKYGLPGEKTPLILDKYGNTGGPSVPLTLSLHYGNNPVSTAQLSMLLGYGVGLSWGSTLLKIYPETQFMHMDL
jgi:3-oxoacyl-[acyl-carrier-protein] synthase-3